MAPRICLRICNTRQLRLSYQFVICLDHFHFPHPQQPSLLLLHHFDHTTMANSAPFQTPTKNTSRDDQQSPPSREAVASEKEIAALARECKAAGDLIRLEADQGQ